MGLCCSQAQERPLSNTESFAQVTNSSLLLRRPTGELTETQREAVVGEMMIRAHEYFCASARQILDWTTEAQSTHELTATLHRLAAQTQNYFRSLFLQGTAGENVSFSRITSAQITLASLCATNIDLLRFCNDYKSWWTCAQLKRTALSVPKAKAAKLYNEQARGPFQARGEKDLLRLLTLGKVAQKEELQRQIALDFDILRTQRIEAEERAHARIEDVFECRPLAEARVSDVSSSLLELIDRLPSAGAWDDDPNEDNVPNSGSTVDEVI